jgi:beta-glucosidase-like glycosyl hydrolase
MAATLKHFPGHGTMLEDTHFDVAVDDRPLDAMRATDLVPFVAGIEAGADAVMMAHVTYPQVAPEPAGYAPFWIGEILRGEMGFRGVVFSDDIGMAAAFRRRREGAHRRAPGCRLRRGAGGQPGAGRGIAARDEGRAVQHRWRWPA